MNFWRFVQLVLVVAFIGSINVVLAQALETPLDYLTANETMTVKRQLIALVLGGFTQLWVGFLVDRTKPTGQFIAKIILAGVASAAVIGVVRDVLGFVWQIGGESALAALIGWGGAEFGFATLKKLIPLKEMPASVEATIKDGQK